MGQCDTLQDLEIKELITAEEHIAMQMYYQCQDRPDLTKLPFRQAGEVLEIMAKVYPSE